MVAVPEGGYYFRENDPANSMFVLINSVQQKTSTEHSPKVQRAPRRHDLSFGATHEHDGLVAGAQRERKHALGVGGLVGIGGQKVVQPLVAGLVQKPLYRKF